MPGGIVGDHIAHSGDKHCADPPIDALAGPFPRLGRLINQAEQCAMAQEL